MSAAFMVELLDLVNEKDEVVGVCSREEHEYPSVITRNVVVFLQDSEGRHVVQLRAKSKKHWPGCFDFAACGSVMQGESYLLAAERELQEEIGVRCPLTFMFKEYREVPRQGKVKRLFTAYFCGTYDGEFERTAEVDEVFKFAPEEIEELVAMGDARVMEYFASEWLIIKGASVHRS